jgi:hypothetical protein
METDALIFMIAVQVTVSAITGYFFLKVLRTPPPPGEDSYSDEDE